MKTAKIFKSGNSQALRIPKEFQFKHDVVEIFKHNDELVVREIPENLSKAFELLCEISDDFFVEGRKDSPPQKRDYFE